MKATHFVAVLAVSAISSNLFAQWSPASPLPTTDIYRATRVGINKSSAPTQYALEVGSGGIGITYGDIIGVSDPNTPANQLRILRNGWDLSNGDYLSFFTPGTAGTINTLEKLRITSNGNVSIGGKSDPEAKLHVFEGSALSNNNNDVKLLATFQCSVNGGNTFKSNQWIVRDKTYSNTNDWYSAKLHDGISIDNSFLAPGNNTKTWWERNPNQDIQAWGNGSTTHMMMFAGRVSLNNPSSSPAARLDVKETDGAYHTIIARATHTFDYGYAVTASVSRDWTKAFAVQQSSYINTSVNPETFVVYGNGVTMIGGKQASSGNPNTNPHVDAKLHVNGKAVAKEIVVTQNNWADFVFDQEYKLMPLQELECYYQKNHHLPQVPSTKDISENGNDLGQTDAILLQKIEELTLYIVALQKQVDELKRK